MRRYVLGPVIMCLLVIGLVGAEYGQVAQAQTHSKKETKSVASKEEKATKNTEGKSDVAATTKKLSSPKRKAKTKHISAANGKQGKKAGHLSDVKHKHRKKTAHASAVAHKSRKKADHASAASHKHGKKTHHAKSLKKAKAQHRYTGTHKPKPVKSIKPIEVYQLPSPKPSDLWLAKESPDTYKELLNLEQPEDLTLKVLSSAYGCIGMPYRHGGTTPAGFDCSGFVRYVFHENGIRLGRSSRDQAQEGKPVQISELKPGDLIFFSMNSRKKDRVRIDHVGIYVGNGQFIHASGNRRAPEIRVEGLESRDYLPKVVEIRRVLDDGPEVSAGVTY